VNRTSGGRPNTVGQRANDGAGSGAPARIPARARPVAGRKREPLPSRVEGLPALPPDYAATLDGGLASLGLSLSQATRAAIDGHVRLLLAWTAAINLTAIRGPSAVALAHVLDSLSAVPVLRARGVVDVLDLGSGGGFPGLPIALALPARRALLVESITKKAGFLEVVTAALGVDDRVRVVAARAETLAGQRTHRERWGCVTVRAVAGLAELVELAFPLLRPGGLLVAWKRVPVEAELAAATGLAVALGGGPIELVPSPIPGLGDHVLVLATKHRGTPPIYPRPPAVRRRSGGPAA